MQKVFDNNVFDYISATNSPWILSANIANNLGTSTNKVASQKLVKDLSDSV
jgi:prophage antirepressor-like protein